MATAAVAGRLASKQSARRIVAVAGVTKRIPAVKTGLLLQPGWSTPQRQLASMTNDVPRTMPKDIADMRMTLPNWRRRMSTVTEEDINAAPEPMVRQISAQRNMAMNETTPDHLNPAHFFRLMRSHGTTFFTGVPDSLLKDFCAYITDTVSSENHIIAANEGTAIAAAAGHYLATGNVPVVYLQNSGLGNTINPLLSLCSSKVYAIPTLLLIGWRGEPGKKDEPQHNLQGKLTPGLLTEMGVPYDILPDFSEGAFEVLEKAYATMEKTKAPYALLVRKGTFEKHSMKTQVEAFSKTEYPGILHREEILEKIITVFPNSPLVTTTGFTSREMFEIRVARNESHKRDFLTVGSMGHCSSIALGIAVAKAKTGQQVLCIDGDGAALMHMGAFATAGQSGLKNYKHILINNAIHDSVGGQPTGCNNIDFSAIALACGYKTAKCVSNKDDITHALEELQSQDGPNFLEIRASPGARADLGRPTTTTQQNKEAFMEMLSN